MSHPFPTTSEPSTQASCPRHPGIEATGICQRCGNFICDMCRRRGRDGRSYCEPCLSKALPSLATRSDRFWAHLVDSAIVFVPTLLFLVIPILTARSFDAGEGEEQDLDIFLPLSVFFAFVVPIILQLVVMARTGQSLGKRWRGIRVVRMNGQPISLVRLALLRNLLPVWLSQVTCVFGLIDTFFIFRDDHRCLHDHLADTQVIKVESDEPLRRY